MKSSLDAVDQFAHRRRRLAATLKSGVAIVPTAPERIRNRDAHFPYRFDSYFHYLTGFAEPEAVLVLTMGIAPDSRSRSILFCREKNEERVIWDGFSHGPQGAIEKFGFDEAYPITQLDERMRVIRNSGNVIGLDRIAVMVALNLCHELQQTQGTGNASGTAVDKETLTRLKKKIDKALESY